MASTPVPEYELSQLTFDSGVTRWPAVSSDGHLLAYASTRAGRNDLDLWIQQSTGGLPLRLTDDPADESDPDISPDGSQVVFRSEREGGGAYLVPALGGPARLVAQGARGPRFSPDGTRIAYWSGVVSRYGSGTIVGIRPGAERRHTPASARWVRRR